MLYPEGHPYHWPVIGYMPDLTAASYDDVVAFFKKYYAPSNASLVVAGDIDPVQTRALVEKWFSDVKAAPRAGADDDSGRRADRRAEEDDHRSGAAAASVSGVAHAAASRAGRRGARRASPTCSPAARTRGSTSGSSTTCRSRRTSTRSRHRAALSSSFQIIATPRPGHTVEELQKVIDEEMQKLQREAPTAHEVERSLNQIEASFYNRMERARRLRRQGRSAERLLHRDRRSRLVQRGSRTGIARCRRPTSARPPRNSCRSTGGSS